MSTFPYTVTPIGCGTSVATDTITVELKRTITLTSVTSPANQRVCIHNSIAPITYEITNATNVNVAGLPPGVTRKHTDN
ncbi:MAG: hypothetical protein RMJ66_05850 [Bacteroidia bacterium]|nr:hypothetical protein [Bacteroidia bacterium]